MPRQWFGLKQIQRKEDDVADGRNDTNRDTSYSDR